MTGCSKRINLPWGFYSRLYKVIIPSGIKEKQKLRLGGLGLTDGNGNKGDLYLEVRIRGLEFKG